MLLNCVFCAIVEGRERASVVYEDERVFAFMDIRPVRVGQLVVVPRRHVDHFMDLDDGTATAILLAGQRLARVLRRVLAPRRVGMIVHGFGVAHAHLIVLPLEHAWDITSAQCGAIEGDRVVYRWENVPLAPREELDALAASLHTALARS